MRVVVLSFCLLTACVSAGTNFNPDVAAAVQPGALEADVVRQLGKPNNVTIGPEGGRLLVWVRTEASPIGAKSRTLAMLFTADGRYVRTVSQGQTEVR